VPNRSKHPLSTGQTHLIVRLSKRNNPQPTSACQEWPNIMYKTHQTSDLMGSCTGKLDRYNYMYKTHQPFHLMVSYTGKLHHYNNMYKTHQTSSDLMGSCTGKLDRYNYMYI
jgi:hypothetical protein